MSTRGQTSEKSGASRYIRRIGVSVLFGVGCCALMLFLLSLLMTARDVPQFAVQPMAGFVLIVGGFAAGFCCAKLMRENGLIYGALCGAVLAVIVLTAGLAIQDNAFGVPALLKVAFVLLSAMLGGVLGVNTRRKRRKVKK